MPSLAITGSLGSGKTTAFDLLCEYLPCASTFSADDKNRSLLEEDHEVRQLIKEKLGNDCFDPEGSPNRKRLFELITTDAKAKATLEEILHPRLEGMWMPLAERYKQTDESFFIAEIPLLYEKGLKGFFNKTILVGCSEPVRKERLLLARHLMPEETARLLELQLPQEEKVLKADYLLWNDSCLETLELEIKRLSLQLMTP